MNKKNHLLIGIKMLARVKKWESSLSLPSLSQATGNLVLGYVASFRQNRVLLGRGLV